MPLGIRHIEILVSDLEKSTDFYSKLFSIIGWGQPYKNSFKYDNTKIYLKESTLLKRDMKSKQKNTLGPRHMCFSASDKEMVDNVGKFLVENIIKIIRGPLEVFDEYTPNGGYYAVDFYDPDGFILEVAYKTKI